MTIFSRASNICISRITVLVKKRPSEGRNVRRRIEFFRKKREKRESYFQVRMVIKEIKREECVL